MQFLVDTLTKQQVASDATDQERQGLAGDGAGRGSACRLGLAAGAGGTLDQPVEGAAHELGAPALRYAPGEGHAAALAVDAEHGPDDRLLRRLRIPDQERKQQRGARQTSGFLAQVALVEFQRRLAVEFLENAATGARDAPARTERIPASGTAVRNPDRAPIEAQCRGASRTDGGADANDGVLETRAIACEATTDRNMVADGFLQAGGQRAAVDAHAIGQQDHSGKLLPVQILAQQAAEPAPRVLGPRRIGDVRLDQTEPGVAKTAGDRDQSVLVEIVIKDGSCRTAAEAQGPWADPRERLWRLGRGDGARRPEIEHEIGTGQPIGAGPAHAPANPGSPPQLVHPHVGRAPGLGATLQPQG